MVIVSDTMSLVQKLNRWARARERRNTPGGHGATGTALLREAATRIERAEKALSEATWDLANYTFRGKDVSLGEEAETLLAYYLGRASNSQPKAGNQT